ncbi:MAG: hypothetical protein LBF91_09040 [Azoarcus sp.]|jgi:invasion protein IalB|nr:hypothetical protein [Azoarcus sp.]
MDRETEELPLDLRLAAIITLLSSSALKGVTAGKFAALQHHLGAAVMEAKVQGCHAHLASALQSASQSWLNLCELPAAATRESCPWPHSSLLH